MEELTEHEEQVFVDLRWRLRWPGIEDVKFVAATNPTGKGMHWVKRLWILREFPEELAPYADQFHFVKALPTDNPHLPASYLEKLKSLPAGLRAALMEGSWDVFEGQAFPEWRRDVHTCKPFPIPSWWKRWGGNDPGYNDPGVWYWCAADEDGNVYVYREATFYNEYYSDQARRVAALTGGERIYPWYAGADAFPKEKGSAAGKAWVDHYIEAGLTGFKRVDTSPGTRGKRAGTMHEYLKVKDVLLPDGTPAKRAKLRIFETCPKIIETLPSLPIDELDREAVGDCAIDHWYDALSYAVWSWHTDRSEAPAAPRYAPGSAGALLGHAEVGKAGRKR